MKYFVTKDNIYTSTFEVLKVLDNGQIWVKEIVCFYDSDNKPIILKDRKGIKILLTPGVHGYFSKTNPLFRKQIFKPSETIQFSRNLERFNLKRYYLNLAFSTI